MASNVQKTVNVRKPKVRNAMLLPEVVNVGQDGSVIPVYRMWTSVRRESERATQLYTRSVSTSRARLTVNVCMEGRISQAVFVSPLRSSFQLI